MKPLFYLLPNLALFAVLYRMAALNLWRERPGIFFFLSAWLVYCLAALIASGVHSIESPAFARFYFWLTVAVLALAAFPLARAASALARTPLRAVWVPAICFAAALLIYFLSTRIEPSPGAAALVITCFLCVAAGAVFFVASCGAVENPDKILWRGTGAYFLAFGFGLLLARLLGKSSAANFWPLLACTIVWIAFAWFLAPTPDALICDDRLAVVAGLRFQVLGGRSDLPPATYHLPPAEKRANG